MKKSNIFKSILSVALVVAIMFISSCSTQKRVVRVFTAGSSICISGEDNKTYEIKKIGAKTTTGVLNFNDYYVSENGTPFEITNKKGQVVSTVYLAKKSETYNPQIYEFNLDEYEGCGIIITSEMDYVRIYSGDPTVPHNITIIVDYERTKPCDIEFENVYIDTAEYVSVFRNFSQCDVNIKLEGNNRFVAGEFVGLDEYYEAIHDKKYDEAGDLVIGTTLAFAYYYFEISAANAYIDTIKGNGTFSENFTSSTEHMVSVLKESIDGFGTLINNQPGQDGYEGMPAFVSLGNMYFYGNGTTTIVGGNGCDGTDAYEKGFGANSVKGGDGGDGGSAVVSETLIVDPSTNLVLVAGRPGEGGEGAGYEPQKGFKGSGTNNYKADFTNLG